MPDKKYIDLEGMTTIYNDLRSRMVDGGSGGGTIEGITTTEPRTITSADCKQEYQEYFNKAVSGVEERVPLDNWEQTTSLEGFTSNPHAACIHKGKYIAAFNNMALVSTDGKKWDKLSNDIGMHSSKYGRVYAMASNDKIIICTGLNKMSYSTDDGVLWKNLNLPSSETKTSSYIYSTSKGLFIIKCDQNYYKSYNPAVDGWTKISCGGHPYEIPNTNTIVFNNSTSIKVTKDECKTCVEKSTPKYFYGFGVGKNGRLFGLPEKTNTIYYSDNEGDSWETLVTNLPTSLMLVPKILIYTHDTYLLIGYSNFWMGYSYDLINWYEFKTLASASTQISDPSNAIVKGNKILLRLSNWPLLTFNYPRPFNKIIPWFSSLNEKLTVPESYEPTSIEQDATGTFDYNGTHNLTKFTCKPGYMKVVGDDGTVVEDKSGFDLAAPLTINNLNLNLTPANVADRFVVNEFYSDSTKKAMEIKPGIEGFTTPDQIIKYVEENASAGGEAVLKENGYTILPSGLIVQWGKFDEHNDNSVMKVNFNISFATVFSVIISSMFKMGKINTVNSVSNSSFEVQDFNAKYKTQGYWLAIGV